MTDTELALLLERAKGGQLSNADLSAVARRLEGRPVAETTYMELHVLGRAGSPAYERLVRPYLGCSANPMLARLALQILCDFWGLTDKYIKRVEQFVRRVAWDTDDDVRLVAISTAGEYLRTHERPSLVGELLRITEDGGGRRLTREAAYRSLMRATGREWRELASPATGLDWSKRLDPEILEEARRRGSAVRDDA